MERRENRNLTYTVKLPGSQTRLREMILYVSEKCRDAPRFGKTKLNKIMWRADFQSYAARGVPVTGRAYQRLKAGPAPIEMAPLLGDMADRQAISIEQLSLGEGFVEERIVPNLAADVSLFTDDDLRYVHEAIDYYWSRSAREASDDSHGIAWKTRKDGDPMPYETAYLSDEKLAGAVAQRILRLAHLKGWKSR